MAGGHRALSPALKKRDPTRLASIETVLGYRVTPDVTLRAGHFGMRDFGASGRDHQLGLQLVWARRWW